MSLIGMIGGATMNPKGVSCFKKILHLKNSLWLVSVGEIGSGCFCITYYIDTA